MQDIIKLLPDSVANQIAAGEVVKRPASVIKELVENAADARASRIDIIVKDGGRTLLQVVDNGIGMSPVDARMAFERHATSKISSAADLFSLHTMGFRGEALPSICAIAQVELRTRRVADSMGTRIIVNGSRVESQQPDVCEAGTNMIVRNLFFNVPARRKFMRSDSVETSYILREFERLALVNNSIHFTIDTGTRRIELRPANFRQRISDIWKNNLNSQLVAVDVDTSIVRIHGYVSRPEFARRRNPLQYFIANGRNMYHPRFHKAVLTAFEPLVAKDTQPCYFLRMDVDPDTIDVNIHPTKHEIKFENEQQIWTILHAAVKAALGRNAAVPAIDFGSDALPVDPSGDPSNPSTPHLDVTSDYNPFDSVRNSRPPKDWESLYTGFMSSSMPGDPGFGERPSSSGLSGTELPQDVMNSLSGLSFEKVAAQDPADAGVEVESAPAPLLPGISGSSDMASLCLQYAQKYIVTTSREGIIIIDQYRAHLLILFERYMARMGNEGQTSVGVMFPEILHLDERQLAVLGQMDDELQRIGFRLDRDEADSSVVRVSMVPSMLHNSDVRDVIFGVLESAIDDSVVSGTDIMKRRMALAMARSGAVAGGQRLTPDEMEHLVGELFALPEPAVSPDGRPVYCLLNQHSIESFLR